LPPDAPPFAESLTLDLLDHGYLLLSQALQLSDFGGEYSAVTSEAYRVAAESIESAVRRGRQDEIQEFHLVMAAAAFHLAGYAARAFSTLPIDPSNVSSSERALIFLVRRRLDLLRSHCLSWLESEEHTDAGLVRRLETDDGFDADGAIATALARNFHRAMASFDFALHSGRAEAFAMANDFLVRGTASAAEARHVPQWWLHTLARHFVDDLWQRSLHQVIPDLPPGANGEVWPALRSQFIRALETRSTSEVDLWPSQIEAAMRASDPQDDLVVALPTSAGKTRIAELCILRTLADGKRVVYVTPLRALSGQLERTLSQVFLPLGFSVSSLYGASGVSVVDVGILGSTDIVAATPEKLDFAIRQDPSVLDQVGLIVLDEGHMIGLGTREIRYEVLVQRLLRRADAGDRRLICLSAIFTPGEPFNDFTSWLRSDSPGTAVHSTWRPTRHQPARLLWFSTGGRLEFEQNERPFVPAFVKPLEPRGRARRNSFPQDHNELVIATALTFVEDGQRVLIYSPLRSSVETVARLCIKLHNQGYLPTLLSNDTNLTRALRIGTEWLGTDHVAVEALRLGIAVHHGALPRQFLTEIETLLKGKHLPLAIASPTLAQGIDLSCGALIFHSLYRHGEVIKADEYANVVGRAGRAYVDLDGLTVFPVFEQGRVRNRRLRDYENLQEAAKSRELESGLLELINSLITYLRQSTGYDAGELAEYVLNQEVVWIAPDLGDEESRQRVMSWLADLDTAILGAVEPLECSIDEVSGLLDEVLQSSLWQRRLAGLDESTQTLQRGILRARARWIWERTDDRQRRGFFCAGLGYAAGAFIDENLDGLLESLLRADEMLSRGDVDDAVAEVTILAGILNAVEPFRYKDRDDLDDWPSLLAGWIKGIALNAVLQTGAVEEVSFIQDGIVYRLVWGVEAVRVHAVAKGDPRGVRVGNRVAMALTYGLPYLSAAFLMEAGLPSRSMALDLAELVPRPVTERSELAPWVHELITYLRRVAPWHDEESMRLWSDFVDRWQTHAQGAWVEEQNEWDVRWLDARSRPLPGTGVRIVLDRVPGRGRIFSGDMEHLGDVVGRMDVNRLQGHLDAEVGPAAATVTVTRFGPQPQRQ